MAQKLLEIIFLILKQCELQWEHYSWVFSMFQFFVSLDLHITKPVHLNCKLIAYFAALYFIYNQKVFAWILIYILSVFFIFLDAKEQCTLAVECIKSVATGDAVGIFSRYAEARNKWSKAVNTVKVKNLLMFKKFRKFGTYFTDGAFTQVGHPAVETWGRCCLSKPMKELGCKTTKVLY